VSLQYSTDENLRARQRLWAISKREPQLDLPSWVLQLAGLRGDERVLEVGCGNGAYLSQVDAVGVDLSLGMLRAARHRALGPLVCANAETLPFRDSVFDLVLAPHMLYHVQDRPAAIRELARVLNETGTCVAVTNSAGNQPELVELVERAAGRNWKWWRRSTAGFSLENGADQLKAGFGHVQRVDCPVGTVSITDVDALAGYLLSLESEYLAEAPSWISWTELVEVCRQRADAIIRTTGAFKVSMVMGAFIARNRTPHRSGRSSRPPGSP
jgi:SAM-dependent methyltransferase